MSSLFIRTEAGTSSQAGRQARELAGSEAVAFLNNLQGLDEVKAELNRFLAFARIIGERKKREIKTEPVSMHMLFVGPPGTGKTVIARQVGKLLASVGLLRRGHLVEADKKTLVGQYIGETPKLVQSKFDEARDGVLFVDEAYALADGQFGKEAIDTLLKLMEDFREDVVVIFAGYEAEIAKLLDSNVGLASRFTRRLRFTNYQPETLIRIFEAMVTNGGYRMDESAAREGHRAITDLALRGARDPSFGNARAIRSLYEKVVISQSERLAAVAEDPSSLTDADLITISRADIESATL
jgi:SpoVK/Ycf46/Vps4 family AAA+-type ATPase